MFCIKFTMITFSEFKKKDILDISSGRNLGRATDIVFGKNNGVIEKIITNGKKGGFLSCDTVEIPYNSIVKIGDDAILIELNRKPKPQKCVEICCDCGREENKDEFCDD